jgi:hypothetical protein
MVLPQDVNLAFGVLQEAIQEGVDSQAICSKYPKFAEFMSLKNPHAGTH